MSPLPDLSGGRYGFQMVSLRLPVFSCSLDPNSRSRVLAARSVDLLRDAGHDATLVDLATAGLPSFDNDTVFDSPAYRELHGHISSADGVVLAFPVYNWAPAATVKSLIEATGTTGDGEHTSAWFDKVVTFVCAAGLPHSTMATGSLAQSLQLDFKCIVNPYTATFSERDWAAPDTLAADRHDRLRKTLLVHAELAALLRGRTYRSDWEV